MITAQKFKSLLNGGGSVKLLTTEIANLESEIDTANAELCALPAKRADLILGDDPATAITKLEGRERELEFLVERNSVQADALKRRISELRLTELRPRIEYHQAALRKLVPEIEKAVLALDRVNKAARDALATAIAELGDEAKPLMPVIEYGGVADVDMSLTLWRGNIAYHDARIARNDDGSKPYRRSPIDLKELSEDPYRLGRSIFQ